MIKIENATLGSDFEMFVKDKNGLIVPCPSFFGGTKEKPLSIGNGCYRQIDGVAAEFNIPPTSDANEYADFLLYCIHKGNEILGERGYSLVAKTSHIFDPKQFVHDRHVEFGCKPSVCAYDWEQMKPDADEAGALRTTGAHIHIGFKCEEKDFDGDVIQRMIFCMDKMVGIPALQLDKDTTRRTLYGQAGEFREKYLMEEGIALLEYRCLGGGIMKDDLTFMPMQTLRAIDLYNSDYIFTEEEILLQKRLINHQIEINENSDIKA